MSDPLAIVNDLAFEATQDTYGVVIYQESIMLMLRKLGFTWPEADKWVKSLKINSKSIADWEERVANNELYKKFVALMMGKGVPEADAWKFVERFTSYSFNKGHSFGYAMTAYLQMWLRVHHPLEFWCAALGAEENDEKKRAAYMVAASRDGVIVLPPHVNGQAAWGIEDGGIRMGLQAIKDVGEKAASTIQAGKPFASREDFEARMPRRQVNSKVRAALEGAGALEFDEDAFNASAIALNTTLRDAKINLNVYQRGKPRDES